ncbi:MAG: DUF6478 family protein [Pseudomonadota bacterium]
MAYAKPQPRLRHVPSPWSVGFEQDMVSVKGHFCDDVGFFHDGDGGAGLDASDQTVTLMVGEFTGSYASLALALPDGMAADLDHSHDLRVHLTVAEAQGLTLPGVGLVRVNIDDLSGPWQRAYPWDITLGTVDIPLGPGPEAPRLQRKTNRRAWVDLLLTTPRHCGLVLSHVSLTRAPAPVL